MSMNILCTFHISVSWVCYKKQKQTGKEKNNKTNKNKKQNKTNKNKTKNKQKTKEKHLKSVGDLFACGA